MKRVLKDKTKEAIAAYAFLAPNLLGFLIFTSIPVVVSLLLSFTEWGLFTPPKWVGLKNFIELFQDKRFWQYSLNTVYLMAAIPISMAGSLLLAIALNQKLKGMVIFRTIYYLPTICAGVAIFMLWRLMYNPEFGAFNALIAGFGDLIGLKLTGPNWLTDTVWASRL